MSKRYDEVMEKVEVTDAMRRRILTNIEKLELSPTQRSGMIGFPVIKRLIPIAACFALLLVGAVAARRLIPTETVEPQPTGGVMVANGIVEVSDADALEKTVGFPIKEVTSLPFRVDEISYLSFWKELAEITYTGEGQTAAFRQSLGEKDNSGDYTVYAETETEEIDGLRVTLKGEGQRYSLALWSDGTYAYSLRVDPGLTVSEWEEVLSGVK